MNWMRAFTIRLRMRGAIGMVLALFALVGVTGLLGGKHMAELNDAFMSASVSEVRSVGDIRSALGDVRRHEKDMVIDYEDGVAVLKHRELWAKAIERTKKSLGMLLEGGEDQDNALARRNQDIDAYATASGGSSSRSRTAPTTTRAPPTRCWPRPRSMSARSKRT
jgi:hypothetical protein